MFVTKFGPFNGSTWEALCQQVFKRKHGSEGYQQMPASPGDFGIEGFVLSTGWAFQCYCPEKHYERGELYEKIREKITTDLGKLKTYESELVKRLGSTKISRWVFVTPEVDKNAILVHARTKEQQVIAQKLPFIADDFSVLIHDGDHYIVEINEIRSASGEALIFDEQPPILQKLSGEQEEYESNVKRKCSTRLSDKVNRVDFEQRVTQLSQLTIEAFLGADGFFKRIETASPTTFVKLTRLINEYELYVVEMSATWSGSAEDLTIKVRDGLAQRIAQELTPDFDATNASRVARHMTARWLAVCELNYDD
ncbi:hypothetical protein [Cupriavidus sp. AcVe19-6a]|uniref:hypothetical protein n=1 Tax=Cupriavidus sp. AcVe19-6a TaxID=2821358 RepID=UPI001AE9009D|nr:hypothetical protein [Cupriavidus sp. AcVe19-6a]MBP0639717.1 hypothetical protein [Cupriavidus sp. AcVe19-6a]